MKEKSTEDLNQWMIDSVKPVTDYLNSYAEKETERIYTGSRDLLAATLVGVLIGVLTNVASDFLLNGKLNTGFAVLGLTILVALFAFVIWRFYLIRDLQKYIKRVFDESGRQLKEKFEKDFSASRDNPSPQKQ